MRLIDADALKEEINKKQVVGRFNTILLIDSMPTISDIREVKLKDLTDSEKQELIRLITKYPNGSHVVPDYLQGWRYEE